MRHFAATLVSQPLETIDLSREDELHISMSRAGPESAPTLYPHAPLTDYFLDAPPPSLFAQWTRYCQERPILAITELINMLVFIAGSVVTIHPDQIRASSYDEAHITLFEGLQYPSPESPISRFINGVDRYADAFWTDVSHHLIASKLWTEAFFVSTFDLFKAWLFYFCDAGLIPLRQTAIVAVLAFHTVLTDSISHADRELSRLESAPEPTRDRRYLDLPVITNCRSRVQALRIHSMQLFAQIIRHRCDETDPAIRSLCEARASCMAPDEFGDAHPLRLLVCAVGDPSPAIREEALNQARALLSQIDVDEDCARFLRDLRDGLAEDPVKILQGPDGIRSEGVTLACLRLMTELVGRTLMACPSLGLLCELTVGRSQSLQAAAATLVELALNEAPKLAVNHSAEAHIGGVQQIFFDSQSREIITTGVDDRVGRRLCFPDLCPAPVSEISGMQQEGPTCFTFLATGQVLFGTKTSKILSTDWPDCQSVEMLYRGDAPVAFICSNPNDSTLAFAVKGQVFVRSADDQTEMQLIFKTSHQILFLEFGPKCGTLVIIARDSIVRTYSSDSRELCETSATVHADPGCCLSCFNADSDLFLIDEENLRILNFINGGNVVLDLPKSFGGVGAIAATIGRIALALASGSIVICIFDASGLYPEQILDGSSACWMPLAWAEQSLIAADEFGGIFVWESLFPAPPPPPPPPAPFVISLPTRSVTAHEERGPMTDDDKKRIIALRSEHRTWPEIGRQIERDESTCRKFYQKWEDTGKLRGHLGRPRTSGAVPLSHDERLEPIPLDDEDIEAEMRAPTSFYLRLFPMNRPQHYQNYSRRAEEVEDIFSQFREMMPRGTLARIAHDRADFPQQTISDWYRHWLINREWRPGRAGQSQNHRTFTDEQENGIMATIDAEFLSKHRRFSSRAFKGLVVQVWGRQSPRDCRTDTFSASSSFRLRYLTRHGLSLRTATPKKNEPNRDAAIIKEFLERLRAARDHYGNDHVVNMDETAWKDVQMAGKTIAPKGVKSVPIDVHGDPKAGMSVACTISADARKFPPIYILRADSEQCLNSLLPAVSIDRVTFTHNGWMNTEVMLKYLSWLHFAMNEEPCALVMDSFPGHVTEAVYAKADILAIEIIPVPKGLTGEYQPLDRGGFGPLKKMSQVLWDVRAAREPHLQWNHREAAKLLEVAWAQLPLRVLRSAWRFQDYEEGLSRAQCKQELSRQGLQMVDWGWDDEEEEEQEEESGTDDPAYGRREYIRDTADLSETDQSEPGSTDTENGQYRRLDLVQKRSSARRNVDLRVLPVEVDFHHLDTYPPKWQAQSQMTIGQVHSQKVPTQPSFSEGFRFGPHGRQFNVPEDPLPGGWACPPSVYHPR